MQTENTNSRENARIEEPLPYARRSRIAWFGGSFDPIHNGHIQMAQQLLDRNLCDEIIFIPAAIPPHKSDQVQMSGADRLEMVRLATEHLKSIGYSDIELRREGKSFTFDTMALLKRVYPDSAMSFVIGMDSLRQLHTWHRAVELVQMVDFIVYPRPGVLPPAYIDLEQEFGARYATKLMASILPETMPVYDLSSSAVREAIRRNEDVSAYVPERVCDYIMEHRLYQ